jgi:carbon-monoxide dehydrogenase medium subunit
VPKLEPSARGVYLKAHRRAQDWATVGVAAVVRGSNGSTDAAVALTNMGGTALRATGVEQALAGGASAADAAAKAADGTSPPSDHAASAEYRAALAQVLCRRALEQASA